MQKAKRRCRKEEVTIEPVDVLLGGFSDILYALYACDVYMPLSLFTNASLRTLTREAGTLPCKKIYVSGNWTLPSLSSEQDLCYIRWREAARYVRFAQTLVGIPGVSTALWGARMPLPISKRSNVLT